MKNILLVAMLVLSTSLYGQTLDIYQSLKTPDLASRNSVLLDEQSEISNIAAQSSTSQSIRGYRVRIFFDNGQNARTSALEVMEEFESLYPLVPCNMVYENPYFKVTVGNCLSAEEAIMLWNRVKSSFDRAFVIREDIAFESLQTPVSSSQEAIEKARAEAAAGSSAPLF